MTSSSPNSAFYHDARTGVYAVSFRVSQAVDDRTGTPLKSGSVSSEETCKTILSFMRELNTSPSKFIKSESHMSLQDIDFRKEEDLVRFQNFLFDGGFIDITDAEERTALNIVAQQKIWNVANFLLRNGADHRHYDDRGMAIIHHAAENNALSTIEALVKRRANLNIKSSEGHNAVFFAARAGHAKVIALLLENNVNIMKPDKFGTCVIHWAAGAGQKHILEYLLSINADLCIKDQWNMTALHWASIKGHILVLEYLLAKYGKPILLDKCKEGLSGVHYAAMGNQVKCLHFFFLQKINLQERDLKGRTPLILAQNMQKTRAYEYLERHQNNQNKEQKEILEKLQLLSVSLLNRTHSKSSLPDIVRAPSRAGDRPGYTNKINSEKKPFLLEGKKKLPYRPQIR